MNSCPCNDHGALCGRTLLSGAPWCLAAMGGVAAAWQQEHDVISASIFATAPGMHAGHARGGSLLGLVRKKRERAYVSPSAAGQRAHRPSHECAHAGTQWEARGPTRDRRRRRGRSLPRGYEGCNGPGAGASYGSQVLCGLKCRRVRRRAVVRAASIANPGAYDSRSSSDSS